ncbi:MAG: hypothetical protein WCR42_14755 [bacterium]
MSYQAVIRDNDNNLITSTQISMQISILQSSPSGTAVYVETHKPKTNANGLVSIEIGTGTVIYGSLASINWADGPYYIKTEIDPSGFENYTIIGTTQLISVPYALFAENSNNPGPKGEQGEKGEKGDTGEQGKQGREGDQGKKGYDGVDGISIAKVRIAKDSLFIKLSDSTLINAGQAVLRNQNNVYLFVEDFGARPDDSSFDNSVAIQNALDSALKIGKILYFGKGNYYIKKTLYIRKYLQTEHDEGIKILGAGINQTIITSLVQNQPLIIMENALNKTGKPIPGYFFKGGYIKNIMFQGTTGTGNCLNITGWWAGLLENVQIRNFGGNAVNMPIRNNFGPPNDPKGNAYTDNYSSFISIRNSQFDNNLGWAYYDERDNTSSDLICEKSVFASNYKGGIRFGGQSLRIVGCAIAYNGFGSSSGGGLELGVTGNSSHNNFITQTEFDGNHNYHIKMNSVMNTTVTSNRFLFHDLIDKTKMAPTKGAILLAADSLYPYANNINITNNYIRVDYPTSAFSPKQSLYFVKFLAHAATSNVTIQNNFFQSLPEGFQKYHDFYRYNYYFTSRLGITNNIIIDDPALTEYYPSARGKMPPYLDGIITNSAIDLINANLNIKLPLTSGGLNTLNLPEYTQFYDSTSSTFNIPESGYYEINISLGIESIPVSGTLTFEYFLDNSSVDSHSHNLIQGKKDWIFDKLILYCYAGQKLNIKSNSTSTYLKNINDNSKLFIRLIH